MTAEVQADLFQGWTGWFDNQATSCREHWNNGTRGRFAPRTSIAPHAHHRELRAPWGSNPDLPADAEKEAS